MHLDKQHPRPIYLQLKELLQNQIEQGVYFAHQKLPSERDLCQHHNLSRMTARRALKELIDEGFAYTRIGKGTFVSPQLVNRLSQHKPLILNGATSGANLLNNKYCQKLIGALLTFDCIVIERTVGEILAIHSLETVTSTLFLDIIRYFEQQWLNGKINLFTHNYTITTVRSQLIAMMNAASMSNNGSKIMLACAPGDQHEIGLISLALNLRRRGFVVIYFGPNLTTEEFYQVIEKSQPRLICLSAYTTQSVENIITLSHQHQEMLFTKLEKPILAFGGTVFNQHPEFITDVPGLYLGDTIENAVAKIQDLMTL